MGNHARVPTDDGAEVELYQLCEDIGQKKNLAAEPPKKVAEMKKLLQQIRDQGYSAPRLSK